MPKTISSNHIKKTRKNHVCNKCGDVIPKGSEAEVVRWVKDGSKDYDMHGIMNTYNHLFNCVEIKRLSPLDLALKAVMIALSAKALKDNFKLEKGEKIVSGFQSGGIISAPIVIDSDIIHITSGNFPLETDYICKKIMNALDEKEKLLELTCSKTKTVGDSK